MVHPSSDRVSRTDRGGHPFIDSASGGLREEGGVSRLPKYRSRRPKITPPKFDSQFLGVEKGRLILRMDLGRGIIEPSGGNC